MLKTPKNNINQINKPCHSPLKLNKSSAAMFIDSSILEMEKHSMLAVEEKIGFFSMP